VQSSRKSVPLAVVLVFLFGPLGYLYVNVFWGLMLMAIYFVLSLVSLGMFVPIAFVLNFLLMIVAAVAVSGANKRDVERIQKAVGG
jgi:hypothetical protein